MNIKEAKIGDKVWIRGTIDEDGDFFVGNKSSWIFENELKRTDSADIKLDEELKPEVPQFVADWYEEHKHEFYLELHRLAWELIENLDEDCFVPEKTLNSDFKRWYFRNKTAMKTLINMHQFGYTIEKEKLYTVDLPNGQPLVRGINTLYFSQNLATENVKLTESEIRKDFDWAWREGFQKEVTK
ncbi:DUF1642 domain-containing protein [Streptococcus dysgalactiae]|uniref:DUF1642 domain-containing protein n=1 Tax=Streptococcus dysgalactiae TaxID=1334 RepID=UPI002DD41EAA|nr:DUF1642 domain-containing protein [Streptococcus dysgalactiae]MEC4576843.1 DUF1642 domain-containing protein [Streptococcus dysgalactiae]